MADETTTPAGEPGGEGAPAPEALTADKVRTIVSGMLKTTLAKSVADATGALEAKLGSELASIKELLSAKPKEERQTPDAPKKEDKPAHTATPDPRLAELEKKLAKLETENKAANERAARERARSAELIAISSLKQQLAGKVRPEALDVVAELVKARGLISYDDEGNATMKVRVSLGKGQGDEEHELPIDEAVPHWLKSKEAALFVPAPSTGAGGQKRPAPRAPNGQFNGQQPKSPIEAFEAEHGSIEDVL